MLLETLLLTNMRTKHLLMGVFGLEIGKFYSLNLKTPMGRAEILSITLLLPQVGKLHMPFMQIINFALGSQTTFCMYVFDLF
jgi:hypothetical protein